MAKTTAFKAGDQVKITKDLRADPAKDCKDQEAVCEGEYPYTLLAVAGGKVALLPWQDSFGQGYGQTLLVNIEGTKYLTKMLKDHERVPETGNYCYILYGFRFRLPNGEVIFEQEMNCEKVR